MIVDEYVGSIGSNEYASDDEHSKEDFTRDYDDVLSPSKNSRTDGQYFSSKTGQILLQELKAEFEQMRKDSAAKFQKLEESLMGKYQTLSRDMLQA